MPSGLAFSTDVHNKNNCKDSSQATVNNMGMERGRMCKEPDDQSSGKAMAKIASKTAAASSTYRRDVYNSLQRRSMQQRIRDALRRDNGRCTGGTS